ncbi:MAG: hypothetical protein RR620_05575 [Clostridium sp.]
MSHLIIQFILYKNSNRFSVSDDGKTLVIQSNFGSMPHGNHILAIADQRYQVNSSTEGNSVINKESALVNFNEEKSVVPSMRVPFSVGDRPAITKPIAIQVLSPLSMFITFNNPIMEPLKSELNHAQFLSVGNQTLKVVKTVRATNDFKKVLIYLDESTALKPSEDGTDLIALTIGTGTNITVGTSPSVTDGALYDAWGIVVQSCTMENIFVPTVRPTIIKVKQDQNPLNIDNTVIDVKYSTNMVVDDSKQSIINMDNYTLTDFNGDIVKINNVGLKNKDKSYASITTNEVLPTGWYTLNVVNVTDTIGGELDLPNPIKVYVEDITIPEVEEIIATNYNFDVDDTIDPKKSDSYVNNINNVMVVKFKTPMRVKADGTLTADNAADNEKNYRLLPSDLGNSLSAQITSITEDNRWFRYVLDEPIKKYKPFFLTDASGNVTSNPKDTPHYTLFCGYNLLKGFRYITNTAGNVLPFCDGMPVRLLGTRINYQLGKAIIEDSETIKLAITPVNNEVFAVDKKDFSAVVINGAVNTPLVITDVYIDPTNSGNIVIKVQADVLTAETADVKVAINLSGNTVDIFDRDIYCGKVSPSGTGGVSVDPQEFTKVVGNLVNNIASKLESISFVSLTDLVSADGILSGSKIANIRLSFAGNIVKTNKSDFIVLATSLLQPAINYNCPVVHAKINDTMKNSIDIYCKVDKSIEPTQLRLSVATNNATNIITEGENGVKISKISSTNAMLVNSISANFVNTSSATENIDTISYNYASYGNSDFDLVSTVTLPDVKTIVGGTNTIITTPVVLPIESNIVNTINVVPKRFEYIIEMGCGEIIIEANAEDTTVGLFVDSTDIAIDNSKTVSISLNIKPSAEIEIIINLGVGVGFNKNAVGNSIRFIPDQRLFATINDQKQFIADSVYYNAVATVE